MKIYFSPASPFVRKVMASATELGIADRIKRLPSAAHPVNRDQTIVADNPLGQVPTFFTDEGTVLYDSRVICEYLDTVAGGGLFPASGWERWQVLVEQALADGLLGAALLARYEFLVRPEDKQWLPWREGQMNKIRSALDRMNQWAPDLGDRVDIGTISIGCALGYLDFRFPSFPWRENRHPLADWFAAFSQRPSMVATRPHA